jgi:hypothetical protein
MQEEIHGSKKRKTIPNGRDKDCSSDRDARVLGELQSEGQGTRHDSISASPQNSNRRAKAQHGVPSPGEVIAQLIRANQQQIEYLEAQNKLLSELMNGSDLEK